MFYPPRNTFFSKISAITPYEIPPKNIKYKIFKTIRNIRNPVYKKKRPLRVCNEISENILLFRRLKNKTAFEISILK
jgi:hypothetical protein